MKEIKAVFQRFMLGDVCDALEQIPGLPGLTVSEVLVYGVTGIENPHEEEGRAFAKMTKLELVVTDEIAPVVVDAIARAAHTGKAGDGKVFVYEVQEAVRIRTGERGPSAI